MNPLKAKMISLIASTVLTTAALGTSLGTTYALYSKETSVTAHVKVGKLKFSFSRTKLEGEALDNDGLLSPIAPDTTVLDLSQNGADALSASNAIPGAFYKATFTLENKGTTAFTTKVEIPTASIVLVGVKNDDRADVLEHLTATFGEEEAMPLSSESLTYELPLLKVKEKKEFTLTLAFDPTLGNEMQDAEISLGLKLTATQAQ